MNNTEKQVHEEFERIREECTRAPGPEGEGFPEWTQDGVESLPEFFDGTAHLWDARFGEIYRCLHEATAAQVPRTDEAIAILDVGCGTGLEFDFIFERVPNARITGLDQAPRMLAELRRKYADRSDQISLVQASCLEWPQNLAGFDVAISILTLHHFPAKTKRGIYSSIRSSLKKTGIYIEGDQMVNPAIENNDLFDAWIAKLPDGKLGAWNYDIRLSPATNRRLILEAGFKRCEKVWDDGDDGPDGHAILVAS
ncbi:MAG: methyltransferase domain-containing protein [Gemmatimonadota bacterium]|nr:methyltransferase domain-containing protein [Gemmatimonadota bacterium]